MYHYIQIKVLFTASSYLGAVDPTWRPRQSVGSFKKRLGEDVSTASPISTTRSTRVLDTDYEVLICQDHTRVLVLPEPPVETRMGRASTRPFWRCGTTYHVGLD